MRECGGHILFHLKKMITAGFSGTMMTNNLVKSKTWKSKKRKALSQKDTGVEGSESLECHGLNLLPCSSPVNTFPSCSAPGKSFIQ